MFELLKKYGFPIVIAILIGAFLLLNHDDAGEKVEQSNQVPDEENKSADEEEQTTANVIVDVKGEVTDPGVYEIEPEARVNDVIQMAGGFTNDADQTTVNLAQKVQDEMIVMVAKTGEQPSASAPENSGSDKIRINDATQEEIEELSGIGPSKAEAIIQYREENGLFETANDLLDVSGIGEKTLESLKDDIQVP